MAENKTITLPDVGDFQDIEIIEILIAAGDVVEPEQSIVVLESDKATMEIPSPFAGTIESILVNVGDRLNEGDQIATLSASDAAAKAEEPQQSAAPVEAEVPPVESAPERADEVPAVAETVEEGIGPVVGRFIGCVVPSEFQCSILGVAKSDKRISRREITPRDIEVHS